MSRWRQASVQTKDHRLLIATTNRGKFRELSSLLADCPVTLVSLADLGIDVEIEETGSSLAENATLKASSYAYMSGLMTLADDSGLEVDALGGEPGHLSSRYAGPDSTDARLIAHLLQKLNNVSDESRHGCFRCVIAIAVPGGSIDLYHGECRGMIQRKPSGDVGFGYDPVFYLPELGKTMAELSPNEKNCVSHRGKAARKVAAVLKCDEDMTIRNSKPA